LAQAPDRAIRAPCTPVLVPQWLRPQVALTRAAAAHGGGGYAAAVEPTTGRRL